MKILMRNGSPFNTQRLFLGTTPVGVFDAQISLNDAEKKRIIDFCHLIWEHLMDATGNPDFTGMIRFDLVPEFLEDRTINPVGIYEVNAHSPECIAVAAALGQKNIVQILVNHLKQTFGDSQIAFVAGRCPAKDAWGKVLFDTLRECKLNIVRMSEDEVIRDRPSLLWRFGDSRTMVGDASHFSPKFSQWLRENSKSLRIFNSILSEEQDFSRKTHLVSSDMAEVDRVLGENRMLGSEEDIRWSLQKNHKRLTVKPVGGASGDNIYFGEKLTQDEWVSKLGDLLTAGEYCICESRWLPVRDDLAFDVSPAFWVHDKKLYPLYVLIRADHASVYQRKRIINVAQGAGVAEMIPF